MKIIVQFIKPIVSHLNVIQMSSLYSLYFSLEMTLSALSNKAVMTVCFEDVELCDV